MPTITRGDLVALTAPQPLVSGITIPAGTQFEVLAVFTNFHGDAAVNLAKPGSDEIAAWAWWNAAWAASKSKGEGDDDGK